MKCAHSSIPVTSSICADIICRATDSAMYIQCRKCSYGQYLMATVGSLAFNNEDFSDDAVGQEPVPTPETTVEPQKEAVTMETITVKELFDAAGVPKGSRTILASALRSGNIPGGANGKKVKNILAERNLTLEQIVFPPVKKPEYSVEELTKETPMNIDQWPKGQPKGTSEGAAIARELDTSELSEALTERLAGQRPIPGSIGQAMSLESILFELTARLPDATITITLNHAHR